MSLSLAPMAYLPVLHAISSEDSTPEPPMILDLSAKKRPRTPVTPDDYRYSPTSIDQYTTPDSRYSPSDMDSCTSPRSVSCRSESSEVSSTESRDLNSNYESFKCKQTRPFKAYLKDPFSMTLGPITEDVLAIDSTEAYQEFRQKLLSKVQYTHTATNKNMRRSQSQNADIADPTYREKRKKNNEAAKRSRDARRLKEDEIAIRCAFLEQEHIQLKLQLASLESERQRLQKLLKS